MIEKFIKFKEPVIFGGRDGAEDGIVFRTQVVMTDGRNLLISDAQHGKGIYAVDETLVFQCDDEGEVTDWTEVTGGRFARTEDIIKLLNES